MKNISLTINPNTIASYVPPMPVNQQGMPAFPKAIPSVSLSAQFEDEDEALMFAKFILAMIKDFKNGEAE